MAESINVTDLAVKVPAALTTADQIMVFDQTGDTNRTPLFEAVAEANFQNGCVCIQQLERVVTSAELLASNTTPIELLPALPAGQAYDVISVIASTDGNFTAPPYATNTTLEVIQNGATVAQFTSSFLASTTNRIVKFMPNNVAIASNSNVDDNGALQLKTFGGDPTAGTYDIKVYLAYRVLTL
jgi:hypothetical protein